LLVGGAGNDKLAGGSGIDTYLFRPGFGKDTVAGFTSQDLLDLNGLGFATAAAAKAAMTQVGHDVVLKVGGDQLVLEGVHLADIKLAQIIASDQTTGPSSSQSPYLVSLQPTTVEFTSILTTGDSVGGYRMAGIPDGLGAFDNGDGTFTVLMNHEISSGNGAMRAHGAAGAFVSEWVIDKTTLEVKSGHDLMHDAWLYNTATGQYEDHNAALGNGVVFSRFCSADLPATSALYNVATGLGFNPADGRIFLDGEESGAGGRPMAHIVGGGQDGNSYELAWLGNMAYENLLANPFTGNKTVVGMLNDTASAQNNLSGQTVFAGTDRGEVYFYFGDKSDSGLAIDKAGLTGGGMYAVKIAGMEFETDATTKASVTGAHFDLVGAGNGGSADVHLLDGNTIELNSQTAHATGFERPEDGAWDTIDHNRFYFVTTASIDGHSKLWELDFTNAADPSLGGTVKLLVDGTEGDGHRMWDNITVSPDGKITLQEDTGNDAHDAAIWQYDPLTSALTKLAEHDPSRFTSGGPNFITIDEESSGVLDVSDILGNAGEHVYLLDTQSHLSVGGELVEGGQLQLMRELLV
jgi:hypothetical protein